MFYTFSLQVEDEIQTLTQVLAAKEKQVAEIKRKLGINPLNELKQNLSKSWQEVTTSTAYVPLPVSGICVPPTASRAAAEERLHLLPLLPCIYHFNYLSLNRSWEDSCLNLFMPLFPAVKMIWSCYDLLPCCWVLILVFCLWWSGIRRPQKPCLKWDRRRRQRSPAWVQLLPENWRMWGERISESPSDSDPNTPY